jgi:hypothetical protein
MKLRLGIFIVVCFVFIARIIGINYGFPYAIGHFDEIFSIRQALAYGATRSLRPIMYEWPAFYSYVLLFIYGLWFLLGKLLGIFKDVSNFAFIYIKSPGLFYVIGRLFNVVISTLTVILVYKIGKNFYNKSVGVLASLLLGFSPFYVLHSHWALVDTLMSFLGVCSFIFLYRFLYLQTSELKNYLLAGFFIGLAIATKFNIAVLILPFFLAHIFKKMDTKDKFLNKCLFLGVFMIIAGVFVGSPYCILDFKEYLRALQYTTAVVKFGAFGTVRFDHWIWLPKDLLKADLTIGFIFIIGVIYCIFRKKRYDWLFLSAIISLYLFTAKWQKADLHYITMVFPYMALMAACMLNDLYMHILRDKKGIACIGLAILFIFPITKIIKNDLLLLEKDTRIQAKEWIESNIPSASKIAMYSVRYRNDPPIISSLDSEFYTFDFGPKAQDRFLNKNFKDLLFSYLNSQKTYRIYRLEKRINESELSKILAKINYKADARYLRSYYQEEWFGISELKEKSVEYIILSSFLYRRYTDINLNTDHPLYIKFVKDKVYFNNLMNSKDLILLKEFNSENKIAPSIRIYKLVYSK